MLYGDWVSAAYQLKARGATSASDPDVVVNRWFRLDATMLQRVQTLRAGIETLRSTDYGKYVYREWDSARMREDGQKSKGQGCACRDAKALPGGLDLPGTDHSLPGLGS